MVIPDAIIICAVAVLAGILGFLSRSVIELRTRLAIVEAEKARGKEDLNRIEAKINHMDGKLDNLSVQVARGRPLYTGPDPEGTT